MPNPGRGGWGFSAWLDGREVHHGCGGVRKSTNNAMELTALVKALEWLKSNTETVGTEVEIVSDSRYLVDGTNSWRLKWRRNGWKTSGKKSGRVKNVALWQAMDSLVDTLDVTVNWERGHNGNPGNERAHELADRGRTRGSHLSLRKNTRQPEGNFTQKRGGLGRGNVVLLPSLASDTTRIQAAELLLRHGDIDEVVYATIVERCRPRELAPALAVPDRQPVTCE